EWLRVGRSRCGGDGGDDGHGASSYDGSEAGAIISAGLKEIMQSQMNTDTEKIRSTESFIPGGAGKLFYRSVMPAGTAWARLALLHGYGDHCGRYLHLFKWLAERGVACHAIDFRGHGRSEGKRGFVRRWEEFLDDADAL